MATDAGVDDFSLSRWSDVDYQQLASWSTYSSYDRVGHSPARYNVPGRAINAFAREILLTAKQRLEVGGWRVVHGIVDSIWVTLDPGIDGEDRKDLETLATEIAERVEIRLEHETHYDWVAFVPQRESDAGALTNYFGKVAGDDFKIRGIEVHQRSTPPFIEEVQRECLERSDATRSSEAVLGHLRDAIDQLDAGQIPIEQLVERNRVSKPLEGYIQSTQNVAALKRACDQDLAVHPGQNIEYVVVDDAKTSRERVALAHEKVETYDPDYYGTTHQSR